MRTRKTDESQEFQGPPGQIAGAWVEHRLEIGERDFIQDGLVIIDVKGPPAPVVTLHAEQPSQATLQDLAFFLVWESGFVQGDEHRCRIVIVRIEIVVEFKRPATRLPTAVLDLPVSLAQHLLTHHPLDGSAYMRMGAGQPRVGQGRNG